MGGIDDVLRNQQVMARQVRQLRINDGRRGAGGRTRASSIPTGLLASHDLVTLDAAADELLTLTDQELGFATKAANVFLAGPVSGGAAVPTFRAMVAADLPAQAVQTTDANWIDLTDGGVTALHTHTGGGVTDHGALTGLGDDDHGLYLLTSGGRALTGNWVQSGAFNIYQAGAMRVGSSSAPTNTTAGDLTVVRLNVGNVAFGTGVESVLGGDATASGFLRIGSNTAPNNTTAGDITGVRLSLANLAHSGTNGWFLNQTGTMTDTGGTGRAQWFDYTVAPASASGTQFKGVTFQMNFAHGANALTGGSTNLLEFVPLISGVGTIAAITSIKVYGMIGLSVPASYNVTSIIMFAGSPFFRSGASPLLAAGVTFFSANAAESAYQAGDAITTMIGFHVANFGNAAIGTAIGLNITALTGATTNFGIRNASNLVQTQYARFGAITAPLSTTDGDVTMLRLNVGNIAFAAGGTVAQINQATLGSDVLRLMSTATNDDPVEILQQNRAATTDATVTTLHTITIPASTTMMITATVVARRTGGVSGTAEDGAAYTLVACVKNAAGTATLIGVVNQLTLMEDQAGWDATIDVTGATARIRVTGAAANNVTWHATVRIWIVGT